MSLLIAYKDALSYWRLMSTAADADALRLNSCAKATADAKRELEFQKDASPSLADRRKATGQSVPYGSDAEYGRNGLIECPDASTTASQKARSNPYRRMRHELVQTLAHAKFSPPGVMPPFDTLVATTSLVSRNSLVRGNLWSEELPDRSFIRYDKNFLISTPEFCFLQMARILSLPRLIELGFELCGTYTIIERAPFESNATPIDADEEAAVPDIKSQESSGSKNSKAMASHAQRKDGPTKGGRSARHRKEQTFVVMDNAFCGIEQDASEIDPQFIDRYATFMLSRTYALTSTAKLCRFLEECPGAHGAKKARRALRYVIDGSASPRETQVAMMLSLPYKLGGYGLPAPKLNREITVKAKGSGKRTFSCDAYWPESQIALEYESNEHHLEEKKFATDSHRRSLIESGGMTVFTLTNREVCDSGSFNEFTHALAKRLGKRLRYTDPAFTRAHLELRRDLSI